MTRESVGTPERAAWRPWLLALALLFFAVAVLRSGTALGLATGGAMLAFAGVAIQAVSALAGGIGVLLRRAWVRIALVAFGAGALLQAVAEVFVYGTRPLLTAVGACLAIAAALIVVAVLVDPELPPRRSRA